MTHDDTPTWPTAARDAREAALEAYLDENVDDTDRAAAEYASWSEDAIIHWRARAIWADSSDVRDLEEQFGFGADDDAETRIAYCVSAALHAEFTETIDALLDEDDDEDLADETDEERAARRDARVQNGNAWMRLGLHDTGAERRAQTQQETA